MPRVHPFRAVQYQSGKGDLSGVVAPPYDVLDAAGKQRLLARDPRNIVGIDLPHTPAKELGPPATYETAAAAYRRFLQDGTLSRRERPAIYAYRQTFQSAGQTIQRCGIACCVEVAPFGPRPGGGILAHEETFSGPKEDRFALMKATRAQLSPIFGLHADERSRVTEFIGRFISAAAHATATTEDKTRHEVWTIEDDAQFREYQSILKGEDVFIADGHHRYTTGLNYLGLLEGKGPVPPDHPARRCMIVLVPMSDPGLVIWPTHRVLGGMADYSFEKFVAASGGRIRTEPVSGDLGALERALTDSSRWGEQRFGLYDFGTGRCFLAAPMDSAALGARFPEKPRAWRDLVVAFIQYVIVDEICQPQLNGGRPVKWAFPHTVAEVAQIGKGAETGAGGGAGFAQLAVIVRPTPLAAVKEISRANVLMPQKSTFFYPKLATGLWINSLE